MVPTPQRRRARPFLSALAARWIRRWGEPDPGAPHAANLTDALAAVAGRLAALARGPPPPAESGHHPLRRARVRDQAVDDARLPWPSVDGVRFLDVMQARGLTFKHVFLIGFNADLLPRRPREDLFLRDRVRERLRDTSAKPLPVRREAREEEWLLFAMAWRRRPSRSP